MESHPCFLPLNVPEIPELVAWDPVPMMEVGKLYNLTCRVAKAAPLRNLTVTLRKGKGDLHVETFGSHSTPEAADVVVTHTITAEKEDHGEEATCRAALDLRPEGHLFEKASLGQVLQVYGKSRFGIRASVLNSVAGRVMLRVAVAQKECF